jgi:hypothetical protein
VAIKMRDNSEGIHLTFANGWTISIATGKHNYCHQGDSAELAAWDGKGNWLPLGDADDVIGYQSADDVAHLIQRIAGKSEVK